MAGTQGQDGRKSAGQALSASPAKVIDGIALMFLGVALMSYGVHFVAKNGTCSGTGYVDYGPVRRCSGNEALYIMSAFFAGPLSAIVGWALARAWGWLWPATCIGVGIALVTIREQTAAAGAGAFGLFVGLCLFALAVLSVTVTLRKRHRLRTAPAAAWPATTFVADPPPPAWSAYAEPQVATEDRPDPLGPSRIR
jgi:hypothetical protein